MRVADAGSFNKAAEEAYSTPTAVIKQINLLEASLDVKLFERTHRGLTLTKAGESLYQDAKYIVQYCKESVTCARNAMHENTSVLCIGTSLTTLAQLLMQLWPKIQRHCSDIKFQLSPLKICSKTPAKSWGIWENIDVIAGIFDETMLGLRSCTELELSREPLCCAVSVYHPLAAKNKLQFKDLYGETLLMMHRA